MSGTLYLVGTPIGNLSDFSPRGIEILRQADFIAAEDTRVTMKLLSHFEIKLSGGKNLISYYEHNKMQRGGEIIERLLAGESCALVSDAGMPCISDPGEELVRQCAELGIPVRTIPGPSAAIAALTLSGLPTARFSFEGFLSMNRKNRRQHLEEIRHDRRTLIFYEAPHKLPATLRDLYEVLGDRRISIARELTKVYEEVIRTTLSEAVKNLEESKFRGEIVLVVEGDTKEPEKPEFSLEDALALARDFLAAGDPPSKAAKRAAARTGLPKSDLYRHLTRSEEALNEIDSH